MLDDLEMEEKEELRKKIQNG